MNYDAITYYEPLKINFYERANFKKTVAAASCLCGREPAPYRPVKQIGAAEFRLKARLVPKADDSPFFRVKRPVSPPQPPRQQAQINFIINL